MRLNNIEQLKKLEAEKTQGEWFARPFRNGSIGVDFLLADINNVDDLKIGDITYTKDLKYIALLANMGPKLLKLVDAVEALKLSEEKDDHADDWLRKRGNLYDALEALK